MQNVEKLLTSKARQLVVDAIDQFCVNNVKNADLGDDGIALAKAVAGKKSNLTAGDLADKLLLTFQNYLPEVYNSIAFARYQMREEIAALGSEHEKVDEVVADRAMAHLMELKFKGALELEWHINRWWPIAVAIFSD